MNDAEAAYQHYRDMHSDIYASDEHAFVTGYSAASTTTAARVEEAVRATVAAAAKKCDDSKRFLKDKAKYSMSSEYTVIYNERHDEADELSDEIRALDVAAIVARVMGAQGDA